VAVWAGGAAVLVGIALAAWWGRGSSTTVSATQFELPQLTGTGQVRLTDYRGKPVVVTLFASWCDACQQELPVFADVARQRAPGVVFIGVDSYETGDGPAMARRYGLAQSGFVLARDTGSGSSAYHDAIGARGMPATAFYSPRGQLLQVDQGEVSMDSLTSTINRLFGPS
jgi:cytochrome c biogenesis protein CcmG/thiol:disulfide interchange protein DsbE